jgi:hypothetical protein
MGLKPTPANALETVTGTDLPSTLSMDSSVPRKDLRRRNRYEEEKPNARPPASRRCRKGMGAALLEQTENRVFSMG